MAEDLPRRETDMKTRYKIIGGTLLGLATGAALALQGAGPGAIKFDDGRNAGHD